MNFSLRITCVILLALTAIAVLPSCGGGSQRPAILPNPEGGGSNPDNSGLAILRDASGAPTGVRVYIWRDNTADTSGYYLYRDTQPITSADPALRVNSGNLIPQPPPAQQSIVFDDLFPARSGVTYYYRAATVDIDAEESELSFERNITIAPFSISNFSPSQARAGQYVYIYGNFFGEYDAGADSVYFSGVKNDKGPSALIPAFVQADVIVWENTRIIARVPIGSTVGPIRVVCNNVPLETATNFTCLSPYILSVSPDPATAGQSFDIYGANFGEPSGLNMLLVDGVAYPGIFRAWSPDHVICQLPSDLMEGLSRIELLIGTEVTNYYYCDILSP